jgi:hypothetical protein
LSPRRRHAYAALLLLAVLCAFFWPLLLGREMTHSHFLFSQLPWAPDRPADLATPVGNGAVDAPLEYDPLLRLARDQVHDGRLPLWNPSSYGGMTLAGNFQTALWFPLTWIGFVLPVDSAWGVIALLKLLIAGLGAYALAQRFRLPWGASLVAGTVYMLSAPNLVWLQWPLATVFAVFPWLLLAADRMAAEPDRRSLGLVALAVGAALLAGHPETAFLATCAAAVYLLALAGFSRGLRHAGAALLRFAGGAVLGAGVAAASLLPFLDAWSYSITREAHGELSDAALPLWGSAVWFLPNLFGAGRPDYAGPPFSYLSVAAYFGVAAILLAGVAAWRRRESVRGRALALMALLAAMTAFGVPPVSWFLETVPPWSSGNNQRVFFVVALAGALAAGAGVASLMRRPLAVRHAALWAAWLAAGMAVLLALLALTDHLPGSGGDERKALALFALTLAAGFGLLVALGRVSIRVGIGLALAVAVLEMAYLQDWNPVLPGDQAHPDAPPVVAALGREPGTFRVTGIRRSLRDPLVLPPNTAALYGLGDAQGYDYPQPRRWADLSWHVLGWRGITRELNYLTPGAPRGPALTALRMANVAYYVAPPGTDPPDRAFEPVYEGRDATLFRDREALPRAYVVGAVREASEEEALRVLQRGELDPRREALVPPGEALPGGVEPGDTEPGGESSPGAFTPARTERVHDGRLRVRIPPGTPAGWLVVASSYSPSWSAEVDGEEVEPRPTNHALMGLPLPAGARVVELSADSRWLVTGLAVSGLSLVIALLCLGRRRPSSAPSPGSRAARSA